MDQKADVEWLDFNFKRDQDHNDFQSWNICITDTDQLVEVRHFNKTSLVGESYALYFGREFICKNPTREQIYGLLHVLRNRIK